ncbi:MAG: GumC family protein [Pseudomonadota bacterium]
MTRIPGDYPLASSYATGSRTLIAVPETSLGDELRSAFGALWHRKLLIVAITALSTLGALAYTHLATPMYISTTELLIDPRGKSLTENDVIPAGLGSSALGGDAALVESQVSILRSQSVTDQLIGLLDLEDDPEFGGGSGGSSVIADTVRAILYGNAETYRRSAYDRARRGLVRLVDIYRAGSTYVIRISSRSEDPNKAALIANTLAQLYLESAAVYAQSSTLAAAGQFDARLEDLQSAWTRAAEAVEEYRAERGLIDTQDVLVVEQQLRDASTQFALAQFEAEQARAALEQAQRSLGSPLGSITSTQESAVTADLRALIAEVSAEERAAATTFLPQHPTLSLLREQRQSLQTALREELAREVERLQTAFNIAADNAETLQARIDQLQTQTASAGTDSIRLRALEQEADVSQRLYEQFLARAMEVNEQVGLQNDLTRIISEAFPASRPSHPRGLLVVLASILAGGVFGVLIAWLLHILNGTPRYQMALPASKRFAETVD